MSLNWTVDQIENYKNVCWIGDEDSPEGITINPITKGLIFMTIGVGLGAITKDNADEFYARTHIIEQVRGQMTHIGGEGIFLSPDDVRRHIGLTTNVSNETRAQWARRIFVGNKRDIDVSVTSDYARNYRESVTIQKHKEATA